VVRSHATVAFAAERQVARRTGAMSCVLRIGGDQLDADALAPRVGLPIYRIDRKGQPRVPRGRGVFQTSTVHLDVSEAPFSDLQAQVGDAIAFLTKNSDALGAAIQFPGVERATLDFAVEAKDVAIDSKYLPPELMRLAGDLGIGIELSIYPQGRGGDA
jgi:hypothetical protein